MHHFSNDIFFDRQNDARLDRFTIKTKLSFEVCGRHKNMFGEDQFIILVQEFVSGSTNFVDVVIVPNFVPIQYYVFSPSTIINFHKKFHGQLQN